MPVPADVEAPSVTVDVLSIVITLPKPSSSATLTVPRVLLTLPVIGCDW